MRSSEAQPQIHIGYRLPNYNCVLVLITTVVLVLIITVVFLVSIRRPHMQQTI